MFQLMILGYICWHGVDTNVCGQKYLGPKIYWHSGFHFMISFDKTFPR